MWLHAQHLDQSIRFPVSLMDNDDSHTSGLTLSLPYGSSKIPVDFLLYLLQTNHPQVKKWSYLHVWPSPFFPLSICLKRKRLSMDRAAVQNWICPAGDRLSHSPKKMPDSQKQLWQISFCLMDWREVGWLHYCRGYVTERILITSVLWLVISPLMLSGIA